MHLLPQEAAGDGYRTDSTQITGEAVQLLSISQLLPRIWFVVSLSLLYKAYFALTDNLYIPYVYT
eukprot:SAG31_NODE_13645_length_855_cov_2.189153_1_plen_64_part_10